MVIQSRLLANGAHRCDQVDVLETLVITNDFLFLHFQHRFPDISIL